MRKEKGRKKKDARVRYEDGGAEVHRTSIAGRRKKYCASAELHVCGCENILHAYTDAHETKI